MRRKNIRTLIFRRGLNILSLSLRFFCIYHPCSAPISRRERGEENRERSLVCEIRGWKITGRCCFFFCPFLFLSLFSAPLSFFSFSNVEKLHSSFNSRGKDEKRPLLVLWNSSMKNYHGDLKRVTRKRGEGERERKRQSVAKKILKSMSIYYSPVSLNQFPIFIWPTIAARRRARKEEEEKRKEERKNELRPESYG